MPEMQENTALLPGKNQKYHYTPAHTNSVSKRTRRIGRKRLCAVVLLAVILWAGVSFYHRKSQEKGYALCTKEGHKVYTVDKENTVVQCIVVEGTGIVGTYSDIAHLRESGYRAMIRYTKPGAIIVPGLSDSHVHSLEYGYSRALPLDSARSIPDAVALVREYILANPDIYSNKSKVIEGWGWDKTIWPVEEYPTAADLEADPVIRGRQVMLRSKDMHSSWVSKATLDVNAPFPEEYEGGVIMRDENGNPTGIFQDEAQGLIKPPQLTDDDLMKRFMVTVNDALKYGVTSMHDAGSTPGPLAFFQRVAAKRTLPIRMYAMKYFNETWDYPPPVPSEVELKNRLNNRSIKIIGDGSLRSGGAFLFEPYTDDPSTVGFMRHSPEILKKRIPELLKNGWQVNTHAIGDRANSEILDAFEIAANDGVDLRALRPRIEHAQIMRQIDIDRMGTLGVIASVQPTHATDDMWYGEARLGPERVRGLYAFRSILNSGARITTGSDIPVEGVNPLEGFYAAVTRVDKQGRSPHGPGGWFPEQKLTRLEALRGMTIEPAYASFSEDILGSLEKGKKADFVVLSEDIMEIPAEKILEVNVHATVLDGEVVYRSF
ncbi:amidohydrolase 3 [Moniliophthora roreri MCA 2997]|uniref:Amidohydrolase 3 n=1 Tax=Moniliophthora roreri (strain MCA 2997) TaxID=1381753 RepID=V2WSJ9_MONRO|nr:amidohydrolase 3 [Moniliophthora roreri MCA 2997]